ncbi:MAG: hypothetical protein GF308_11455 [Candidatus Heimdallarchaeota archaeon]|nr:hypothetical protein [Candidatus Heimdallarchaeota archaeon]
MSKEIRILGIVGSPRRKGNTELLVNEVLKGAEKVGAISEKVILNELDIAFCQACNACTNNRKCIQNDDMEIVVNKMRKNDVWVFGTPIYWWGPSAQFKTFIDRWYGVESSLFFNKKIILTISLGASSAHYARHTLGMFEDIIPYRNAELFETILALGMGSKGAVKNKPEILTKARNAGESVIESLNK